MPSAIITVKTDSRSDNYYFKTELLGRFGVSPETLRKYCKLARANIGDYLDYSRDANYQVVDRLPLNEYQIWVIGQIIGFAKKSRSDTITKLWINENKHLLTKEKFDAIH